MKQVAGGNNTSNTQSIKDFSRSDLQHPQPSEKLLTIAISPSPFSNEVQVTEKNVDISPDMAVNILGHHNPKQYSSNHNLQGPIDQIELINNSQDDNYDKLLTLNQS